MNHPKWLAAPLFAAGMMVAQATLAQIVKIDGSSTVYPITEAVAEEFQKSKKGAIKLAANKGAASHFG